MRRGEPAAFRSLYERHAAEIQGFCRHMLGSRQDAEDAAQATFASAYRAIVANQDPIAMRPWLFAIARNKCLDMLRSRHEHVELNGELALTGDPVRHAEVSEEMASMIRGIQSLPETQRSSLLLAEIHGMRHTEIASVLGVRPEQVKAFIHQARSNLISERAANDTSCAEIRQELACAGRMALRRSRLRRHLRSCEGCQSFADSVSAQGRELRAIFPLLPLAAKYQDLEAALGLGAGGSAIAAGTAIVGSSPAQLVGGGVSTLALKVAAGVAAVGASAGIGASVLSSSSARRSHATPAFAAEAQPRLVLSSVTTRDAAQAEPPLIRGTRHVRYGSHVLRPTRAKPARYANAGPGERAMSPHRSHGRSGDSSETRAQGSGREQPALAPTTSVTREREGSNSSPRNFEKKAERETDAREAVEKRAERETDAREALERRAARLGRKQSSHHRGGHGESVEGSEASSESATGGESPRRSGEGPSGYSEAPKSKAQREKRREERQREARRRRRQREHRRQHERHTRKRQDDAESPGEP